MKKELVFKILEIFVPALTTLMVGFFGGQSVWQNVTINNIVDKSGITVDESSENKIDTISEQLAQNQEEIEQLKKEKESAESEAIDLKKENGELSTKLKNMPDIEYENAKIYLDGGELSQLRNAVLSVDGDLFYSEDTLKTVFGHQNVGYEYTDNAVYIGEKKEVDKLPLSKAEVYERGDKFSTNSGIREDKSGNEFSGLLVTDYRSYGGYISYFVNGKYDKISGVIHVTAETDNDHVARIKINIIDEYGNPVTAYTSPELTNLSKPAYFPDVDISGAKIVTIEQEAVSRGAIEAVISEAYFYNE